MVAGLNERDVGPDLLTTPAPSWPSTQSVYPVGSAPDAEYRSVWQTPQASSRTRASPAFGSASSISWTTSGCPNSSSTAALTFIAAILCRARRLTAGAWGTTFVRQRMTEQQTSDRDSTEDVLEPQPEHAEPRLADPTPVDLSKRDYLAILVRAGKGP